jgi:hypothetical protein
VVVCGDRPDGDVRAANRNGCLAVLVRIEGTEFANVAAASPDDVPWRTIAHVAELPALLASAGAPIGTTHHGDTETRRLGRESRPPTGMQSPG